MIAIQNLMTEWHIRYCGPGIMVYWHVEKKSACIYSQLKSCSLSEVAAMIAGVLRHCTEMELRREVHEALNVIENWNSANAFILYGKGGEIATNRVVIVAIRFVRVAETQPAHRLLGVG